MNGLALSPEGLQIENEIKDMAKKGIQFFSIIQREENFKNPKLYNRMKELNVPVDMIKAYEVKEQIRAERMASIEYLSGVADAEQIEMAKNNYDVIGSNILEVDQNNEIQNWTLFRDKFAILSLTYF